MLKKLRLKFVGSSMGAIALVLLVIVGGINLNNYIQITENADRTLQIIADNGGRFPYRFPISERPLEEEAKIQKSDKASGSSGESGDGTENAVDKDDRKGHLMPSGMSPETPYETRFFTVVLSEKGEILSTNLDRIAAVDAETAESYAKELFESGKTGGFKGNYRYRTVLSEEGRMCIFLDCTKSLGTFRDFLRTSLLFSLIGLAAVFLLVALFSGMVMKPFAEVYTKQKRFITDANHELKTPLTVIAADCEILEYNLGENEWTEAIKEQVAHLTELTNHLVFLSRMDEENRKTVFSDFSLSEVATEVANTFAPVAAAQNKKFTFETAPNLSLCGDVAMIKELFSLILDNAVKYSDKEGNIEWKLSGYGKGVKIVLSNTTDGVPEGELSRLFERFYRLDSSRSRQTGGHGVGLSMAKSIVEAHKGRITAKSPDGKLIVFTIIF